MPSLDRASCPSFLRRLLASGALAFLCLGFWFSPETHGLQAAQAQPQTQPVSASAEHPAQEPSGEMTVKEEPATKADEATTFRVNVRLVLARVVVRDDRGHAVGNLSKEDFELLDNGKPQVISHFAVENPISPAVPLPSGAGAGQSSKPAAQAPVIPERYLIYLFDDLHLKFEDLSRVRAAAEHRVDALLPSDRVAVFSTSGQTMLDFTDDRAKLHQMLERLQPRPMFGRSSDNCPDISLYMADMIVNKRDQEMTQTAITRYLDCIDSLQPPTLSPAGGIAAKPGLVQNASTFVLQMAEQVLAIGQQESRLAIGALKDAVRRLSVMPGQKTLILASPGFVTPEMEYDYYDLIDRALRARGYQHIGRARPLRGASFRRCQSARASGHRCERPGLDPCFASSD